METLYHWVGVMVVWGGATFALGLGAVFTWEAAWFAGVKRRMSHVQLLFSHLVLRRTPRPMSRNVASIIIAMASRKRRGPYDWWERWLAAYLVRYSRRIGFTE